MPEIVDAFNVQTRMLRSSDALEQERCSGLCMNALVIGNSRKGTLLWFGHGCSGYRMVSNMNVIMVWS